jgi:hypothetical protein
LQVPVLPIPIAAFAVDVAAAVAAVLVLDDMAMLAIEVAVVLGIEVVMDDIEDISMEDMSIPGIDSILWCLCWCMFL